MLARSFGFRNLESFELIRPIPLQNTLNINQNGAPDLSMEREPLQGHEDGEHRALLAIQFYLDYNQMRLNDLLLVRRMDHTFNVEF